MFRESAHCAAAIALASAFALEMYCEFRAIGGDGRGREDDDDDDGDDDDDDADARGRCGGITRSRGRVGRRARDARTG